jgi:hypothetical protein
MNDTIFFERVNRALNRIMARLDALDRSTQRLQRLSAPKAARKGARVSACHAINSQFQIKIARHSPFSFGA